MAKIKDFFKRITTGIEQFNNSDSGTASFILMFYLALFFGATAFIATLAQSMGCINSLFIMFGSYISLKIIYNFFHDFTELIKQYNERRKKEQSEK